MWGQGRGSRVYSRWEKGVKTRDSQALRWWEVGVVGKNYTTLHNILQLVNCKMVGANKKGQELAGIQGLRTQEGWTPCLSTMPISGGLKLPTSRTL